jgi:hypothetical protein
MWWLHSCLQGLVNPAGALLTHTYALLMSSYSCSRPRKSTVNADVVQIALQGL